jgi:uncharacterized protein (TIGR00369 family)
VTLLETYRAIVRGDAPTRPAYALIGIRFVSAEPGRTVFELQAEERHYASPLGYVHGGILCSLADTAAGSAHGSTLDEGEYTVTLELKVNFLRPARSGKLTAVGRLIQRGRTAGLAECDITDEEGRLIARATATCMTVRSDAVGNDDRT